MMWSLNVLVKIQSMKKEEVSDIHIVLIHRC